MGLKSRNFTDSTMSYFVNQLDNFDKTLNDPLVGYTWGRDIKLRPGVSITNESTSFVRSNYAATGTQSAQGLPWISSQSNSLPGVSIDGERVVSPIRLLGRELTYTSVQLQRSQMLGTPIDTEQMTALQQTYQMSTDQMVYIGSTEVNQEGLVNSSQITTSNVPVGASGFTEFSEKTPQEQVEDINNLLLATWNASGQAVCPDKLGLPSSQWTLLNGENISLAGENSTLNYLKKNTICNELNGKPLDIVSMKYLAGAGVGGTDRMIAYTNDVKRVRFISIPMQAETKYYMGINYHSPYIWAYGAMEFVYPETLQYADGI